MADKAAMTSKPECVLILGAPGTDFHTFNVCFRDDPNFQVVAFTAAQIPGIEGRRYPPCLSGANYPAFPSIPRNNWKN